MGFNETVMTLMRSNGALTPSKRRAGSKRERGYARRREEKRHDRGRRTARTRRVFVSGGKKDLSGETQSFEGVVTFREEAFSAARRRRRGASGRVPAKSVTLSKRAARSPSMTRNRVQTLSSCSVHATAARSPRARKRARRTSSYSITSN